MNQTSIGSYIALKRKQKNLTQGQLAEMLSVSNKTISKWETGKCMPDYATIPSLCEALDITVAELLDGEDAEPNSLRLYDNKQTLELIAAAQTRVTNTSLLEAGHSIMIGIAFIATAIALMDVKPLIASFIIGITAVIIVLGIYSVIEERRFASKAKNRP
ncbi:helix-turn-helix domain-containing protein [Xiamenia xianingshaonis]|uniref:Helix-turn-helix domain-containing protein n=1 Tax=Xiamenia xianingshaonis TaxID=2682776 RepID=A0ABX0IFG7_9ACTN|nr:helix-turn-helix domain-containing protein [Xiamenia xianingshaonis]NHM13554.1 helix-turn-helix domain-containing protein [Xiamenia xianingshaonis]